MKDGNTTITGLIGGIYQFQLKVTDNNGASNTSVMRVTVNIPPNIPPTVYAGADTSATLPQDSITVTGTAADQDGTISSVSWVQISGPSTATIVSPTSYSTKIKNLVAGNYSFQFSGTDNGGLTASDLLNITVYAANVVPVANAGPDITLTLPDSTIQLIGSGTDADGYIVSYLWEKVSGPIGSVIVAPNDSSTAVTGLKEGQYQFKLTVTDNKGATGVDYVIVTVKPATPPVNNPPVANAGGDQIRTLPPNTITLVGSGTDTDGTIVEYKWTKIDGPTGGNISSPNSATTLITALVPGVYRFNLRVKDNLGDTGTNSMTLTVYAANIGPSVNAGSNQIIVLPQNSTTLTATASDPDGTISSYSWVLLPGSTAGGTIVSPNSATTNITGLTQGVNVYEVTVKDNSGDSAKSSVQVTVNPAPVLTAPTANAGADSAVQLPRDSVHLLGSGTNGTGTIISHVWSLYSKPTGAPNPTIDNVNNYNVVVGNLVETPQSEPYLFLLTVTDNNGLIGTDLVQVVVRPIIVGGIKALLGYDIRVN